MYIYTYIPTYINITCLICIMLKNILLKDGTLLTQNLDNILAPSSKKFLQILT